MWVVVRCTECRGAARVTTLSVGQEVRCPHCARPFVAVEEAALMVPGPGWVPPPAAPFSRRVSNPNTNTPPTLISPAEDDDDFEPDWDDEPDDADADDANAAPASDSHDFDHDPHAETAGTVPASVLIGFALLPFLIPILWMIAPVVINRTPTMTIAAPLSLATAAGVLCLAVISTIDWTPSTRIKGVLFLVVLSYLTGVGLFFLDKDTVDRVRKFFGVESRWVVSQPPGQGYQIKAPAGLSEDRGSPPLGLITLTCFQATQRDVLGSTKFVIGSSPDPKLGIPRNVMLPALGSDAWFRLVIEEIVAQANGTLQEQPRQLKYADTLFPGREFLIKLPEGTYRVVQLFVVKDRVYYLAVEGPAVVPDDNIVLRFFESFEVTDAK